MLAGHSLRAGLATQAGMNGATELAIMKQTGHRSLAMLRRYIRGGEMWRYIRGGEMWRKNAAASLGLYARTALSDAEGRNTVQVQCNQ
jgi:hypothetical protein